jgi:hypothetical protein
MCFSAEADFVSGAVVGAVGIATLREVDDKRALPLAALPLAFAAHQVTEGFVWLGLEGTIPSRWGDLATYVYLLYAWVLLPLLVPWSVALVEGELRRRRAMHVLTALGGIVAAYMLIAMSGADIGARINGHTIEYSGAGDLGNVATALYVLVTCGSFLMSSSKPIRWFGAANLAAVVVIGWYQASALTSLWCIWGAIASVLLYFHFAHARAADRSHDVTVR